MTGSDVCVRFGLMPDPPPPGAKLGVSRSALEGEWPLHGLRHRAEHGTSGWYLWAGEYSADPDFFVPLHVEHIAERLPAAVQYLSLPPGSRFLLAPRHEDVWQDPSLLTSN